jgi:hypothetical protein
VTVLKRMFRASAYTLNWKKATMLCSSNANHVQVHCKVPHLPPAVLHDTATCPQPSRRASVSASSPRPEHLPPHTSCLIRAASAYHARYQLHRRRPRPQVPRCVPLIPYPLLSTWCISSHLPSSRRGAHSSELGNTAPAQRPAVTDIRRKLARYTDTGA